MRAWWPPFLLGLAFLAGWSLYVLVSGIEPFLLPAPWDVARAGWEQRLRLLDGVGRTFSTAASGFLLSAALGYLLAVVMALSVRVRRALYPWILVMQMIPVIILAPILVLWFDTGFRSATGIAFLISFFPVVANSVEGLLSTDANQRDLFRSLGASRWQTLIHLMVPASIPAATTGLRIAATLAPIGAIAGEFFAGRVVNGGGGLGILVILYNSRLQVPELFATGLAACLVGFVFVGAVHLFGRWACGRWQAVHRGEA